MNATVNLAMDALGMSANTQVETSSLTAAADQSVSGEFLNLVQTLVEGQQDATAQTDDVRAGQQTREEPEKESGESSNDTVLLPSCLLGSSGSVQQLPAQPENVELTQAPASTDKAVATTETSALPAVAAGLAATPVQNVPIVSDKSDMSDESDNTPAKAAPGKAAAQEQQPVEQAAKLGQPEPETQVQPEAEAPQAEASRARTHEAQPEQAAKPEKPVPPRAEKPETGHAIAHDSAPAPQASDRAKAVTEAQGPLPAPQAVTHMAENARPARPAERTVKPANVDRKPADVGSRPVDTPNKPAEPDQAAVTQSQAPSEAVAPSVRQANGSNSAAVTATPATAVPMEAPVKPVEKSEKPAIVSENAHSATQVAEAPVRAHDNAQPASVSAAHPQPAREIGTRVINQIVRSARTHFFEGGAAMTLRLDPPHLGAVRMNVMAVNGAVTAVLETTNETARHILQADLGALKEALAQSGVNLDNINVTVNVVQDQTWNPYGKQGETGNAYGHRNTPWTTAASNMQEEASPLVAMAGAAENSGYGLNYLA